MSDFDESQYAPGFDYLCTDCGDVHHGPHQGMHFENPEMVNKIEGNRNISHGKCPECYHRFMAEYHRERRRRLFHKDRPAAAD